VTETIHSQSLAASLRHTIFGGSEHWHVYPTIDSTNVTAMEAAGNGAPEGSVFLADEQTAGRGRGAHGWHSPAGSGIYLSAVLRPKLSASEVLSVSLAAGVAAHTAIERVTGIDIDLRWPNDLLFNERKLGGILIESASDGERVRHLVVGIGLNVNHADFPADIASTATSLRMVTGREWPRTELIFALLESLDAEYRGLASGAEGRRSLNRRFADCSSYAQGARVSVDDHGQGSYSGTTAGLDERGFLQVLTENGLRTVISGGVRKI
jgi:BirA family transcriptional regulator, biotin operon repressor / biotin---[acetyl-CoA-carboxylase] ligase